MSHALRIATDTSAHRPHYAISASSRSPCAEEFRDLLQCLWKTPGKACQSKYRDLYMCLSQNR